MAKKYTNFLRILLAAGCGVFFACMVAQEGVCAMKHAVMIIAEENFRDEELFQTKAALEEKGITVKIASTTLNPVRGMLGAQATPELLVKDITLTDFDAVIFVGGSGADQYWDDHLAHTIAQTAMRENRVVAAICIAPVTLARAGVLKDIRATVYPSEKEELVLHGATYSGAEVEVDGNCITASGPAAAQGFGEAIARALEK
ncbi:MAG: DJ-1/PfpI family protein [Candidatus Omnitrophica bacterium]|nr:DJ-1/PfpI family protein [Candidatus Omnitrophota bacterium]